MPKLKELVVIGLNSGTSMDGVDAAAFKIRPAGVGSSGDTKLHIEMIDSLLYEYEPLFQRNLKRLVARAQATLDEFSRLDAALGIVFSQAACALMRKSGLTRQTVDLIGSHGQTIWHAPGNQSFWGIISTRNTTQLGRPEIIATNTGVSVIADFRSADMAAGGQGAPLTPFADQVLFGGLRQNIGILNLGGIANITILNAQGHAVMAYDTGPGNSLIDRAATVLFGQSYDKGGALAAGGRVNEQWLQQLKDQPYYFLLPPKTTGRELFGTDYADSLCRQGLSQELSAVEIMATLTALTASTVADSYRSFIAPSIHIEELVLGGGGSQNKFLQKMLVSYWPHPLKLSSHEDYGISSKFKESLLFALLAYTTHFGIPNNVPICTGASRQICLGKLSSPPKI